MNDTTAGGDGKANYTKAFCPCLKWVSPANPDEGDDDVIC